MPPGEASPPANRPVSVCRSGRRRSVTTTSFWSTLKMQPWQVIAGLVSSSMFVFSTLSMLLKAFRTKDLKSYSLGNIALSNLGNLVHWVYVAGLPVGPIWFLHGFSSLTTALMLLWYLRYEMGCAIASIPQWLNGSPPCLSAARWDRQ